jgi:phosphotransacetylase
MLGIEFIRTTRRATLQCLRVACEQCRELMGISQVKKRNIDGMICGHEQSFPQTYFQKSETSQL